ncbi:hypothetical protein BJY01DRAFT_254375 [Aspergillus pseudoustus]|uniref:GPI anchored protein n=1 Tax=Aspergillus pseudoustus TaxID=1810923 RepID=A0ABR4IU35_9EURO
MFKSLALVLLAYTSSAIATDNANTDTVLAATTLPDDTISHTETYYGPTGSSSIIPPDHLEPTGGHVQTTPPWWSHPIATPTASPSIILPPGSSTSDTTSTTTTVGDPEFTGAARALDMPVYAAVGVLVAGLIV